MRGCKVVNCLRDPRFSRLVGTPDLWRKDEHMITAYTALTQRRAVKIIELGLRLIELFKK